MPADHSTLWQVPVTYGAIGATQAEDLLQYPPLGYRPLERVVRIGHGAQRWEFAWIQTMSWGIQRRSGMKVAPIPAPAEVNDGTYTPVTFDESGEPVQASTIGEAGEAVYAADGTELIRPGDTALMRLLLWPRPVPARVVYVIDEPQRKGFAYGTLPGHPERGEEAFIVEYRNDDSVWLTIRAFSRPASWLIWVGYPFARLMQAISTSRYERALTGALD